MVRNKLTTHEKTALQYLRSNARYSASAIGRMAKTPRHAIDYAIDQLEKDGVIGGYRTAINFRKLGYYSVHVFLETQTAQDQKRIVQRATQNPFVNLVFTYIGAYSVELSFIVEHPEQFKQCYTEVLGECVIINESIHFTLHSLKQSVLPLLEKIPLGTTRKRDSSFSGSFTKQTLSYSPDALDLKLLSILAEQGDITVTQLSELLNLSKDTVKVHIDHLIRSGIIAQFVPHINFEALGLTLTTLLIKAPQSDHPQKKDFERFLSMHPHVLWAGSCLGEYSYIVYVLSSENTEIKNLVNAVKNKFGEFMQVYTILHIDEQVKYSYFCRGIVEKSK